MDDEVKVKRYREALDRAASDLAAAKLALEEVQEKIDRGLVAGRPSIVDIHGFVNSTLQTILLMLKESGPLPGNDAGEVRQKQVGTGSYGTDRSTGTEGAALRKISLQKVWHAGKQWAGGGVIGWESALPEKGSPYQLHLEGGMVLETSPVQAVEKTPNAQIIRTVNSVYQLIYLEETPKDIAESKSTGSPQKKPMASAGKDRRLTNTTVDDKT